MELEYFFELTGTYFFAISGVIASEDEDKNWFGAAFTGFITAIGGGSLRDMTLGSYPLVWVGDVNFLYAIIAGVITTYLFYQVVSKLKKTLLLFDTLGIAFFTILGTEKALSLGVRPEIAAMMGMFTAVMGGVIRDTLTNATPVIFRKEIYASACLVGAIFYLVLNAFEVSRNLNLIISSGVIIAIRMIVLKYGITLPKIKNNPDR
ncbi:MAG TPA: trimeric intracellular cation channel family protein [Cytophagaceae bacterium]